MFLHVKGGNHEVNAHTQHVYIRIFLFSEMERKLDAFTAYTLLCTKRNGEKKLFLTKGFWT